MREGKVLAVDYGTRRVGLASGNFEFGIAFPREIIENHSDQDVVFKIKDICEELEVVTIVVGLPLNMQEGQKENTVMKRVNAFVSLLEKELQGVEIVLEDERLSSFEAANLAAPGDRVDAHAAQVVLQRFFDRQ